MQRRNFVALSTIAFALPGALLAQAKRTYRVAILDSASETSRPQHWAAFRERLKELGLVEGENVTFVARYAHAQHERLPALAAELIAGKPDIIVCAGTPESRAAMRATAEIPILFATAGDPTGTGLVTSLARPGGNVTGFSAAAPETAVKNLELLLDFAPGVRRIAYLSDALNPGVMVIYTHLEEAARKRKLSIRMLDASDKTALERSFAVIRRDRIQGLLVGNPGTVLDHRYRIVQFAAREKLPVVYGRREFVDVGGLLSYGPDRRPNFRGTAELAHRILQGAKPAEIPVQQIAIIQTVLNLKTAKALGLAIPDSIRMRADEVIE